MPPKRAASSPSSGWLHVPPTEYAMHIAELARAAEARGFESLFGLDGYAALGVTRVIVGLPSKDRETVLPLVDQSAKLIA